MPSQYDNKGGYAGYNKNNKERAALDYYATPTEEVTNILNILNLDFEADDIILEPCCGGGHMIRGIEEYCKINNVYPSIVGTDIKDRNPSVTLTSTSCYSGEEYDFLPPDYPIKEADYIIMNPPFSTLEFFVSKGIKMSRKGLLVFGRLQFLESKTRFENIFKDTPPSKIYVYVDRIGCIKNGDPDIKVPKIQAYMWAYWDFLPSVPFTSLNWITSANYKGAK
jgi:hypothetical protein